MKTKLRILLPLLLIGGALLLGPLAPAGSSTGANSAAGLLGTEPYIGEVRWVGFNFAPRGWAFCNGQLLPINQNQSLFSILGTTYGGDGRTNFALPDLRGRSPIHAGPDIRLGERGGTPGVILSLAQLPAHAHPMRGTNELALAAFPGGSILAQTTPTAVYLDPAAGTSGFPPMPPMMVSMDASAVSTTGGSGAHANLQPYTTLNAVIALQGLFPPRN